MDATGGLADLLLEEGLVDQASLHSAERYSERQGCALVSALIEGGHLGEDELVDTLERRLGLPRADLLHGIDLDALREVPLDTVERCAVVPVGMDRSNARKVLHVAMADPLDRAAIGELEFSTGCRVEVQLAALSEITRAIQKHYRGMVTKQIRASAPAVPRPVSYEESGPVADQGPKTQPRHRVDEDASPEMKMRALLAALYAKGVLTEEEFKSQLKKLLAEEPQ